MKSFHQVINIIIHNQMISKPETSPEQGRKMAQ